MSNLLEAPYKRPQFFGVVLISNTPYVSYDQLHLTVIVVSSYILRNNGVEGGSHLMRDRGVDHLQELVPPPRVLVHNIFGLVYHLDQAVLLPHHFVFLALDLQISVRLPSIMLDFIFTIVLSLELVLLTNYDFLEYYVI